MAQLVVSLTNPDSGVRSIQKSVKKLMSQKIMRLCLVEDGGLTIGSHVAYNVDSTREQVSVRMVGRAEDALDVQEEEAAKDAVVAEDSDLYR